MKTGHRPPAPLVAALRDRRRHLGLSLRDVAATIGVDYRTVWNWDSGARSPDAHMIDAYARALGTTAAIGPAPADVDHVKVDRACATGAGWAELTTGEQSAVYGQLRARRWSRTRIARHLALRWATLKEVDARCAGRPVPGSQETDAV